MAVPRRRDGVPLRTSDGKLAKSCDPQYRCPCEAGTDLRPYTGADGYYTPCVRITGIRPPTNSANGIGLSYQNNVWYRFNEVTWPYPFAGLSCWMRACLHWNPSVSAYTCLAATDPQIAVDAYVYRTASGVYMTATALLTGPSGYGYSCSVLFRKFIPDVTRVDCYDWGVIPYYGLSTVSGYNNCALTYADAISHWNVSVEEPMCEIQWIKDFVGPPPPP
jgi:hypothetical protein